MPEGVFGLLAFRNPISDAAAIATRAGAYLSTGQSEVSPLSVTATERFILGMRRSDIGLPTQQTRVFHDPELGVHCAIHGEVHNLDAVARSNSIPARTDLELATRLYRELGPEAARQLNGLFSLVLVDERSSSAVIVNDRFGLAHPIYWVVADGRLCFATHLKTLLDLPGVDASLDREAVALFLRYAYVSSPRSILKGVKKLCPGSILAYDGAAPSETRFWSFDAPTRPGQDQRSAIASYQDVLRSALCRRLEGRRSPGILLSGGLDSSANVALAAPCGRPYLKTFAIGFDDPAIDERPYARIVARHFKTQHFEYTITGREIEDLPSLVWHLEEPYFEGGLFLTYAVLKAARNEVDVIIGGEGADQLFGTGGFAGGLPLALRHVLQHTSLLGPAQALSRSLTAPFFNERDNAAFRLHLLLDRVVDLNNWYTYGYGERELSALFKDPADGVVPRLFRDQDGAIAASFAELYDRTLRNQDVHHYINENLMVKAGRMADMLGLRLRESYLDVEVTDFLVSLAFPLRRSGGLVDHLVGRAQTKYLHRLAVAELLPPEVLVKRKQGGFVPVMMLLGDDTLRNRVYRHLLKSEVLDSLFRREALEKLLAGYERAQQRGTRWRNFLIARANRILFLLTLDIWYHYYLRSRPSETMPVGLGDYLGG